MISTAAVRAILSDPANRSESGEPTLAGELALSLMGTAYDVLDALCEEADREVNRANELGMWATRQMRSRA